MKSLKEIVPESERINYRKNFVPNIKKTVGNTISAVLCVAVLFVMIGGPATLLAYLLIGLSETMPQLPGSLVILIIACAMFFGCRCNTLFKSLICLYRYELPEYYAKTINSLIILGLHVIIAPLALAIGSHFFEQSISFTLLVALRLYIAILLISTLTFLSEPDIDSE